MKRQRVVVKIGSSSLTDPKGGLCHDKLFDHVEAIAYLKQLGHDVILITSGAVAAGFGPLGYPARPTTIAGKPAAAAVGQSFAHAGVQLGVRPNSALRPLSCCSRSPHCLRTVAVPIINENDSVSIEELTFGDNDMLSALVAGFFAR